MASAGVSGIRIAGVACAVPAESRTPRDETGFAPEVGEKISRNTGILTRHVAPKTVCTSDLCYAAAQRLLDSLQWDRKEITGLIFISQTPDYVLPATSFSLHRRLGLSDSCYAFDVNLGCSGYVYGLWLASSLMQTVTGKVLLLVGDTISKLTSSEDQSVAFLFGDAGSATALERDPDALPMFFEMGSDGSGDKSLIVPSGGFRDRKNASSSIRSPRENGNVRSDEELYMDGAEVFSFTLQRVPAMVSKILLASGAEMNDIDAFVFHQANAFMLAHLVKRLKIPQDKFILAMQNYGNTSSASVPVAMGASDLREMLRERPVRLLLAGFGVGFSWAAALLTCGPGIFPEIIEYSGSEVS